jgi:diaminopimelate decarboxylase/aspartate kinase
LFSADPLQEPGARLLQQLDYGEALEMAASGARVVHPRCIRAASDCGLPLVIRDIRRPRLRGTRIERSADGALGGTPLEGVKAVTRQDGMLVILLENLDTRQQVGFLAWVFAVISDLGVSVDLVATSETTTTLAINGVDNHLDRHLVTAMSEKLSRRCRLRLYPNCSCVNLVGRGVRTVLADLGDSARSFQEWPLLMLSLSANDMCLSFLVQAGQANALLHELHERLVVGRATDSHPVFGVAWGDLERAD